MLPVGWGESQPIGIHFSHTMHTGKAQIVDERVERALGDEIIRRVLERRRARKERRMQRAVAAQQRVAVDSHKRPFRQDGEFRMEMRVHRDIYQHWTDREGKECWQDDGFRKDLMRDNPELRVKTEKNMKTVSFAGTGGHFKGAQYDRFDLSKGGTE